MIEIMSRVVWDRCSGFGNERHDVDPLGASNDSEEVAIQH